MRFAYPEDDRRVTAIILNYYEERQPYWWNILETLSESTVIPSKVIVWDNDAVSRRYLLDTPLLPVEYVVDVADHILGRYAAALIADTPYVFIQDNDLTVGPRTIEALLSVSSIYKDKIVGLSGCCFSDVDHPYTEARWINSIIGALVPVDVVLGRCWLAHRSALIPGMRLLLEGVDPGSHADDILFAMAGGGGLVAPYIEGCEITNLDEQGAGLSHEPGHFEERNRFARFMLDRRPLLR